MLTPTATPSDTEHNYIGRIDLQQLTPQLDRKLQKLSLGDLWNLRHLNEIYQKDTVNIYSPISIITDHTPSEWDEGTCYEAD